MEIPDPCPDCGYRSPQWRPFCLKPWVCYDCEPPESELVCAERRMAMLLPDGSWEWVEAVGGEALLDAAESRWEELGFETSREVASFVPENCAEDLGDSEDPGEEKRIRGDLMRSGAVQETANMFEEKLQTGLQEICRQVCKCGSTEFVDIEIHGGQSARRDCKKCGRTFGFSRWYGEETQTGSRQHS